MELDNSYNLNFLNVEENIAETYRKGIKDLRQLDDPIQNLEVLVGIFKTLRQSHPSLNQGVGWAVEIISAYRNLSKILEAIYVAGGKDAYINDLLSKYHFLEKFGHPHENESKLEEALEELENIIDVLKQHGVDDLNITLSEYEELKKQKEGLEKQQAGLKKLENL